jgi:hypothetical protein
MTRAAAGRVDGLGQGEHRVVGGREAVVEPLTDVACQLDVVTLVLADGDLVGVVEEDVGGLQHGVVEQSDADGLALPRGLLLELGHLSQLTEPGRRS